MFTFFSIIFLGKTFGFVFINDKNSEALILCANCKAMDKIDTVENNFVWIPIIKCINNYTGNSLVAV